MAYKVAAKGTITMNIGTKSAIEPFVKWAGGKRQLLDRISERLPQNFNRYYEPFLGGGALLFYLQPEQAVVNDINVELITTYQFIKNNVSELMEVLSQLDEAQVEPYKEYYYAIRERYNKKILTDTLDIQMAAMFIFLNKHCFSGLYRVNRKGLFNVPYNNTTGASFNGDRLLAISEYLQSITIMDGDFDAAYADAQEGDFVFFDSPYAPLNPTSFESYTKTGFSIVDHQRLAELFKKLTEKGCHCMLTNHNTEFIRSLYEGFLVEEVSVRRFINSDAKNRIGKEVIIRNYG